MTDITQGVVPTLLPFFIAEYNLSYAAAAGFVSALSIASTVVQPLFGHFADIFSKPWLMTVGLLLAGYGVASSGAVPSYWLSIACVTLAGFGIAAFHPEAARLVNRVAGEKKATAMSLFAVGGQAGIAVGPLVTTAIVSWWGLKGTLLLIIPVTAMAVVLTRNLLQISTSDGTSRDGSSASTPRFARDAWGPFTLLTLAVICRSIVFYGLNTFVPLYWINILHQSKAAGATALSIMFGTGVLGTLIGGKLADRYGHRNLVRMGFAILIPLLAVFNFIRDVGAGIALLIPIGLVLFSTYSPLIVMGQRYLPNRVGLASGVTLGIAVAIGGVVAPVLGHIADGHGIPATFTVLTFLPVIGLVLSFTLLPPPSP
jgi:MFS transporter, FSR family, fosmidomycin resistance protein